MRTSLCILLLFLGCSMFAQNAEGVIQFEEKINMHRNLPPDAADMRAMIPEFRTGKTELRFNTSESMYQNAEEDEEEEMNSGGGMVIRMQRPDMTFYNNYASGKKTDQREFMGKDYLIEDDINAPAWKITGAAKTILGYNCLQAIASDTVRKREISAWFTDAIPVSAGPVGFVGLPGMVLEVDVNQGEMLWTATRVEFRKLKKNEMKVPEKGEKMTQAAYDAMVDERMKAMNAGGGGGIRIIRN